MNIFFFGIGEIVMALRKLIFTTLGVCMLMWSTSCSKKEQPAKQPTKESTKPAFEVKLITLDPGHFHAALVQKIMYEQVLPTVYVYAPEGEDVRDHLNRIKGFNNRPVNPTHWQEKGYTGDDFLQRMVQDKSGNVVVISGNNRKKAEYIKACVDAGLNVLADKPMCIDTKGFQLIEAAFASAQNNGAILYDIMTERSEITTLLQKDLMHDKTLFGELRKGTVAEPALVKQSVHHFFKHVAGNPIKRPGWYFDTTQQGEGIVDVTTHLVDLVMWAIFPGQAIDYSKDVEIKTAQRWPTLITRDQYSTVTRLKDFPHYLKSKLDDRGALPCYANGEITFALKGIISQVSVTWKFKAPEGAKDTHYSIARGTKANIEILQGKDQNYKAQLYVQPAPGRSAAEFFTALGAAIKELGKKYPGLQIKPEGKKQHILIPEKFRTGHEAHFADVMERYMKYLQQGKLPEWEVPNMKTKYYITTKALELAMK